MSAIQAITEQTLIPDLIRELPQARTVLDRYGLRGCGGRLGPFETIGFFARAHDVPVDRLLEELQSAVEVAEPVPQQERPADAIYRRFFIAGIAVVLTLGASWGAWLLLQIAWHGSFRAAGLHEINAHGHAQIFGWVGLFVMGFAYQAFPRFKHTDLQWPGLAMASWWLMLVGIVVRSVFEPLAATDRMWIGLVMMAAASEVVAIGICVLVLFETWRRATKPLVYFDAYIVSALVWFVVQAIADAVYLAATLVVAPAGQADLVATWQAPLRDLQIHGFALLMILGVSQRMLHHVYGFPEPSARLSLIALPLLNLAVIGEALGIVFMRRFSPAFAAMWYASALLLTGTVTALLINWRLFKRVSDTDRSLKFIRAAYVWLMISLIMMVCMPFYQRGLLPWLAPESVAASTGFSHAYYGAVRHAITVGFISMMIVGVASRIVPTLNGLDGKILPRLWLPFVLLNTGCALRVTGQIVTDFTGSAFPVAGASGLLEVSGLALWGGYMIWIMKGWYRPAGVGGRPNGSVPLVPGQPLVGTNVVGEVIDTYPELLYSFIEFGFRPLANQFMRRQLASRLTIDGACRLLGVDVNQFLEVLNSRMRFSAVALPVVDPKPLSSTSSAPTCSCCQEHGAKVPHDRMAGH